MARRLVTLSVNFTINGDVKIALFTFVAVQIFCLLDSSLSHLSLSVYVLLLWSCS